LEAGHAHVLLIWESAWVTIIVFFPKNFKGYNGIYKLLLYRVTDKYAADADALSIGRETLQIAAYATVTPSESVSDFSNCGSRCTLRLHLL
jgi:hypothetical protein